MVDDIASSTDKKETTVPVFLGLAKNFKPFDTLDHYILLHKLDHYALVWYSYCIQQEKNDIYKVSYSDQYLAHF